MEKRRYRRFRNAPENSFGGLSLQVLNPDHPFVLRIDASGRAIGAVLEQLPEDAGRSSPERVLKG